MCHKYKPKKENRFLTGGITYDISAGKLTYDGVQLEMSSKIPQEIAPIKGLNLKYFRDVRDMMNKGDKKPVDVKMENIIRSTNIQELKERDYVKCTFFYKNSELYTEDEIDKIVKAVSTGKMVLPEIPGITTLPGRAVIFKIRESIYHGAIKNIMDMIKANETVMKKYELSPKKTGAIGENAEKKPAAGHTKKTAQKTAPSKTKTKAKSKTKTKTKTKPAVKAKKKSAGGKGKKK